LWWVLKASKNGLTRKKKAKETVIPRTVNNDFVRHTVQPGHYWAGADGGYQKMLEKCNLCVFDWPLKLWLWEKHHFEKGFQQKRLFLMNLTNTKAF